MDDELVGGNPSTPRTSRIRTRATLTGLVLVVALILLVTTKPWQSPTTPPSSQPAQPTPHASLTPTPTPSSDQQVARFHLTVEGSGHYPRATIEAPYRTWTPYKHFALTNDAANASFGISLWDVGKVARNPCHSIGGLFDPGPTVRDLVGALQEQALRQATKATSVRLAGYSGMHLQWSVPAHWHVVQPRWDVPEFAGCDVQPGGHREFVSWESRGNTGERWQQMAGQVDQLWILDANGQRLVVDAWYSPTATPEQIAAEDQIVNSLRLAPT